MEAKKNGFSRLDTVLEEGWRSKFIAGLLFLFYNHLTRSKQKTSFQPVQIGIFANPFVFIVPTAGQSRYRDILVILHHHTPQPHLPPHPFPPFFFTPPTPFFTLYTSDYPPPTTPIPALLLYPTPSLLYTIYPPPTTPIPSLLLYPTHSLLYTITPHASLLRPSQHPFLFHHTPSQPIHSFPHPTPPIT